MGFANRKIRIPLIFAYKLRLAFSIALVPVITSVMVAALLFIFLKLNLFHMEALGLVINEQVRGAYYDQIIRELSAELPTLTILVTAIFLLGFIVITWAVSPFVRAERLIRRTCLSSTHKEFRYDVHFSEDANFDALIRDFIQEVESGLPVEPTGIIVRRRTQWRFVIEYFLVFGVISALSGAVFSAVFLSVYERVVSLSLQLVMVRNLKGHYFNAQQDVLTDILNFTVTFSFVAYLWIGRVVHRHISINLYVFSRVIAEARFPIPLRSGQTFYGLADALNRAYQKHRVQRA